MNAPICVAIATIPSRERFLPFVLESLRAQADKICVYLNGYERVPEWLPRLANEYVLDHVNNGAERKFHWADKHEGLYFTCDDDIVYPRDYVSTYAEVIAQRGPRCFVTAHGRSYVNRPENVHVVLPYSVGLFRGRVDYTRPVNHGGTGVMAWDTRAVQIPTTWPQQNIADMQLAVWAQNERVPMWIVPHQAHWFKTLAPNDPDGIFANSRREQHRRRNALLYEQGMKQPWQVFATEPTS